MNKMAADETGNQIRPVIPSGIEQVLVHGHIPHAMLFVGEPQTTRTLVEHLANVLLCTGEDRPCGVCESCYLTASGVHPDYFLIDGVESKSIKVAHVQQLQEHLTLRSHTGGRSVYIILGIDLATPVAANRLLKTMEEPNGDVIALMTATSSQRVLPTIQSRCQIFRLDDTNELYPWDDPFSSPVSDPESDESDMFASLLKPMVQWTKALLSKTEPSLVMADEFVNLAKAHELTIALQMLTMWLRDVMHYDLGNRSYIRFLDFERELQEQASMVPAHVLAECIDIVMQAKTRLSAHVGAVLNVENMCIRLQEVLRDVHRGGRTF